MRSRLTLGISLTFLCFFAAAQQSAAPLLSATPKHPVIDEYHGVQVSDDYRWLEDGKNAQVIAWTEAEDQHARALLDPLPLHHQIQRYLKKILDERSPSFYELADRAGLLFAMNSQPGQQQDVLVTLGSPDDLASKRIVVDPNQIDPTHSTAIQFYVPSVDGSKVAVSLASGGSESGTLHIYDVATGAPLPDVVPRVTVIGGGSVAWSADGSGLYYTRYPHEGERPPADMNFYQQIYYHKLGTPVSDDSYVIGKEFPRIAEITLTTNRDGRYLLATVANGDGGQYEHLLRDPAGKWTALTHFSDQVTAAAFGEDGLYMLSRDHAPHGKLLRVSLAHPDFKGAQTIIPETLAVLQDFRFSLSGFSPSYVITPTRLYVVELVGGPTEVHMFDHDGHALGTVPAEPVSSVDQIVALRTDNVLFLNTSWVDPPAWFVFDATSNRTTITAMRETSPESFADVEAVREFAISKDGTKVPVNIIRRKGTKLDGQNPTVLTGYGGFDLSQTPSFDPTVHAWLDAGGVFAIANLRGGAEFGEEWHKAGMLTRKQNVFDDFIASAELLIKAGYTNPSKLGIEGGSNGGLLMGAVLTQRPDLFGAVVSVAGLYDMLRFETTENGQFNATEYGIIKDPEQFRALYTYSPYHHIKDGVKYPSVLFTVGENDPRVDPWHSRKMTARLQAANASGNPILLISFSNAGHGGIGSAEDQRVAMDTYLFEFMYQQLGVKWVNPGGGSK
jgi:prolyl oligopeptidase